MAAVVPTASAQIRRCLPLGRARHSVRAAVLISGARHLCRFIGQSIGCSPGPWEGRIWPQIPSRDCRFPNADYRLRSAKFGSGGTASLLQVRNRLGREDYFAAREATRWRKSLITGLRRGRSRGRGWWRWCRCSWSCRAGPGGWFEWSKRRAGRSGWCCFAGSR